MDFSFETLTRLNTSHPAMRLIAADHAPLILSFLHSAYSATNARTLPESAAIMRLESHLEDLRDSHGADLFPKPARQYLNDWSDAQRGYLRKTLPAGRAEPEFDLTPETEIVLQWLHALTPKAFVGTESRLGTLLELLRQLVGQADVSAENRLELLHAKKRDIEAEIAAVEAGDISGLSNLQVRERYDEIRDIASRLLSDFRAVEHNFRQLDREARQRIARHMGSRGALLDQIFGDRDLITDSEQGQSFRAFWRLLMSPARQTEMDELILAAESLEAISTSQDGDDPGLRRFRLNLASAGDGVHQTLTSLSAQLRRFLDDQAWLENQRLMTMIRDIEALWVDNTQWAEEKHLGDVDGIGPEVTLPVERSLYQPTAKIQVEGDSISASNATIDASALFTQFHVDTERLRRHIRRALRTQSQVELTEIIDQHPIRQGLAELISYLNIATDEPTAVIDEDRMCEIIWRDENDTSWQRATMPTILFTRQ